MKAGELLIGKEIQRIEGFSVLIGICPCDRLQFRRRVAQRENLRQVLATVRKVCAHHGGEVHEYILFVSDPMIKGSGRTRLIHCSVVRLPCRFIPTLTKHLEAFVTLRNLGDARRIDVHEP
jgi:hypothetical protein